MEHLIRHIEDDFGLLILVVLGFSLVLGAAELLWDVFTKKMTWARLKEMVASFSTAIPTQLVDGLSEGVIVVLYIGVYQLIPWQLPVSWWSLLGALLVTDIVHYWTHRWEHEVRCLWAIHSVHHSSYVYNISTAFRILFLRAPLDAMYYLVPVLLGFHPMLVLLSVLMLAIYQIWLHTELVGRLDILEYVLNTPSHHRVHHGANPKYLDRNYSGMLIIWDKLFGTFQTEEERPVYGLTTPLNTSNPLQVHFHECMALVRDLRQAHSWREVAGYLFRPPGWRPDRVTPQGQ